MASIGLTLLAAWRPGKPPTPPSSAISKGLSRDARAARSARVRTLLPMLRTALMIAICMVVGLRRADRDRRERRPADRGAGVVGLAIGFGSQTLVRDVITGIFLLFEDAMAVGDVVQVGTLSGVVEQLSIRSIKLRAQDGSLHIVPFSAVTTVTNMTRDFAFAVIDVNVGYREDTDRVIEVLKEIAAGLREDAKFRTTIRDDLDILGVERLGESGVLIRVRIKTDATGRWGVAREMNRRIKKRFDELRIEIPLPQQRLVMEERAPAPTRAADGRGRRAVMPGGTAPPARAGRPAGRRLRPGRPEIRARRPGGREKTGCRRPGIRPPA